MLRENTTHLMCDIPGDTKFRFDGVESQDFELSVALEIHRLSKQSKPS